MIRVILACIASALAALAIYTMPPGAMAQQQGERRTGFWAIQHSPSANTRATITQPANAQGRNVADCVGITFVADAAAPTAISVGVFLRDGATGAGTILQAWRTAVPAVAGQSAAPIEYCGLNVVGTRNTAMTLEFGAAGGANTIQTVSLSGHVE